MTARTQFSISIEQGRSFKIALSFKALDLSGGMLESTHAATRLCVTERRPLHRRPERPLPGYTDSGRLV